MRTGSIGRTRALLGALLAVLLTGVALVMAQPAHADLNDEVHGTVSDEKGVVVPGAVVTLQRLVDSNFVNVPNATDALGDPNPQDGSFDYDGLDEDPEVEGDETGLADGTYRLVATTPSCTDSTTGNFTIPDATPAPVEIRVQCEYVPTVPTRLLETRPAPFPQQNWAGDKPAANTVVHLPVTGVAGVKADAEAVALNITSVNNVGTEGFLTIWDCTDTVGGDPAGVEPDPPNASNVNMLNNDIRAGFVLTKVNQAGGTDDGKVCIYTRNSSHLLADLNGWVPAGGDFEPLPVPDRVLETRPAPFPQEGYAGGKPLAGQVIAVDLQAVPNDAEAVAVNITGAEPLGGWVTAWDCSDTIGGPAAGVEPDPPNVSALNLEAGLNAANLFIGKPAANGTLCLFTSGSTHLIADVQGWFPAGSHLEVAVPSRVLETRAAAPGGRVDYPANAPKPGANTTVVMDLSDDLPEGAVAAILNITATESSFGYITAYPCADASTPPPNASNLNTLPGQTRPNLAIVQLQAAQKVCLYTSQTTHLVVDLNGFIPAAVGVV
jgi:hypothetical protein